MSKPDPIPGIRIEELVGYTYDRRCCAQSFWGLYGMVRLLSLVGFVTLMVCLFLDLIRFSVYFWLSGVFCMVIFIYTVLHEYRSTPLSAYSGKPVQRYRNLSAPDGVLELLYVDESTKTFSRRVYLVPSDRE